jgi:hypothetical protein
METITSSVKIGDSEIQITKTEPIKEIVTNYERSFIEEQKKNIQAQKAEQMAQRDKEIAECDAILLEMDKLGVVSKIEVIKN